MKKIIYNITKFTTTDYKDHLSCVVWFTSCNMRCLYCYNPDMVLSKEGNYELSDLYKFLSKRVGLLDAVVLSGGEATNHDLVEICETITNLGFKIKLDTNGSNPSQLKELLDNYLIDYVAIDFKATKEKFKDVTNSNFYDNFIKSLSLLQEYEVDYEVRTTLHNDLLDVNDINKMQDILVENNYKNDFYIQNFLEVENLTGLKEADSRFNYALLEDKLNIVWRN